MTSKELVLQTLAGKNTSERAPRQLWTLPWAWMHHEAAVKRILSDFPEDIVNQGAVCSKISPCIKGDAHEIGLYTDDWGCVFTNVQRGVIGEVKTPLVKEDDWSDADGVHVPEEWLTFDVSAVNRSVQESNADKFTLAGACPRPFEQLQFIRGTENLYMDLMDMPGRMRDFLEKMHDFYCRLLKKWAQTDVDGLMMMDDWGSQKSLLISPALWDEVFAPMYRDYIDIAHRAGKKMFMHSDGFTLSVIPKLIDLGLDAFNTQIFCIGLEKLKQFQGKITFWGEIDRQHLIPNGTRRQIAEAVREVKDTLWRDGGCIAQCEFGAGANPDNVYEIYRAWDEVTKRK